MTKATNERKPFPTIKRKIKDLLPCANNSRTHSDEQVAQIASSNKEGEKEYQDVWRIQRKIGRDDEHATKKPIELCERAIRHASKYKQLVLDLFGGSGSTLIAAEKNNRHCYMMELDPKYVDVIIKRWEEFTGKEAVQVNENKTFKSLGEERGVRKVEKNA